MITSDTRENSDDFAFCLANGKKFPSFTDEKPNGTYTLFRDIDKEQYIKFLKENHKWSTIPNPNQAWETFSRLSYMYLKDPTDIVKRAWGTDLKTARTYFHQVIQYEIWRYTDGMRVSSDTNIYEYNALTSQQKDALEMIRADLYKFTVPYKNLEYRFYKPDWVWFLGYQALATVRWKIEPATITVTKKWENVKEGAKKPEVWIQLLKDGKPEGAPKPIEPGKGQTTFEISNKAEINKYSIKEVDKDGHDWKHEDFTAGQPVNKGNGHFEITNTKKEKPTRPAGKLATTVEVDGTKADAQKELELSVATDKITKTVKDTVMYENLLAGETYKLTGQLMKITADKEEEVAKKETTFVAAASGKGTTSLEFENVELEAGVKYVVYETAESEKEIDFKEGKEKHKVEHKDKDDKAQTVVVTKEKPTKPSGKLATTVEVDGTKADAQKELELSVATDKVTKTVKDTVVYENLLAGETYKLTGQLMKITADKEEEVATKETTFVADASGNGTTSLEFEDVSLEAGVKYVVYETAESEKEIDFKEGKEKHKVEHKDKDDKAQTVVVTKEKPTKPSGKLATTVEVDGTKADAQKELELSVATDKVTKTVKDTVVYENLLAGETYKLTGQLMKITADKEEEVATKETTFVADASGNGTTSLEFEDVSLEAGVKYVVYETAESEKEIDFKEGKEKHKVEHKDKDDKAQTVVVYLAVTDIHFSVDETGQVTVTNVNGNTAVAEGNKLTVTDQTKPVTPPSPEEPGAQEVHFSKVNVGGEEIAGAEIHIKQDDTVVASWVSEAGKTHTLKLKPGHYIFHEAVAPGGYLAVTDIHFSVDETGQVTVTNVNGNTAVAEGNKLTVTDQTKPVTPPSPEEPGAQEVHFSKVNVGGEEIAGAEIHIKQDDTVVASWVSEAGKTHTLKLKPGHYIFHEAVAPGGYLAVTDIHFSVDETGQVTVTNVNGNTAVAEGNKLTVTDQSADKDKQDKLPNTGETTGTYLSILGMITAVFASLLYRSKKK
ncbi:putative surface anchored protein [Streptococcus pneumoniae]|nr:putative surface anchored protein [Streptococcus pneumoniae]VNW97103.1 putative surface anchored protein [Streptococcus pneumoniae]